MDDVMGADPLLDDIVTPAARTPSSTGYARTLGQRPRVGNVSLARSIDCRQPSLLLARHHQPVAKKRRKLQTKFEVCKLRAASLWLSRSTYTRTKLKVDEPGIKSLRIVQHESAKNDLFSRAFGLI
jgi:hypothetical protein